MTQTMVRNHKKSHHESVPTTMRAAAIDHYGGPDVLTLHELPVPEPGIKEVLIAVPSPPGPATASSSGFEGRRQP